MDEARLRPDLSLEAARREVERLLVRASGVEAALDARIFMEEATGLDRAAMLRDGERRLGFDAGARLSAMVGRRRAGEPVWRILGQREFWGLTFAVTPAVLDPRPDTETLVAAALDALAPRRALPLRILDLGVGSGAILGALLSELPGAFGCGVDRSAATAQVASANLRQLGLAPRAAVLVGDWATALSSGSFDLVVSNPPYIETAIVATLAPEVRDFDPPAALDGGVDGLDCYRAIIADLPRLLAPGGVAGLEVGAGQSAAVQALLTASGLTTRTARRDLGGHERAVMASLDEAEAEGD